MSIEIRVFEITGTSPLLQHNPASMQQASGGMKKAQATIPTPKEEADAGCYRNAEGVLFMPSIALRASLLGSGVGKKIGKQTAWKMIACGVFNTEVECPLFHPKTNKALKEYTKINTARAVLGSGKNAKGILRSRPQIDEWALKIALEIDTDFITVDQVLTLFNLAGRMIGVGDWRPEKKGPYGRYQVELVK